ncbi:MAG TPA: hypothetical protein VMT52_11370, partial [Planctomycetota bacterium]|nr:hypothetical protein [Planctomycetota bacterium]
MTTHFARGAAGLLSSALLLALGCTTAAIVPGGGPVPRDDEPHAAAASGGGSLLVAWGSVRLDGTADLLVGAPGGQGAPVRVNPRHGSAVAGRQVGP